MRDRNKPEWVDDGLLALRNVTVYVCDGEDVQVHGFDVHLNIGENHELDHICFDATATLHDRSTLGEAWDDAADWLYETANTLMELRNYIRANDVGHETCYVESSLHIEGEYVPVGYWEFEMDCGGSFKWDEPEPPRCCPCCGKPVEESLRGDAE